jgi:hypothetical protein
MGLNGQIWPFQMPDEETSPMMKDLQAIIDPKYSSVPVKKKKRIEVMVKFKMACILGLKRE